MSARDKKIDRIDAADATISSKDSSSDLEALRAENQTLKKELGELRDSFNRMQSLLEDYRKEIEKLENCERGGELYRENETLKKRVEALEERAKEREKEKSPKIKRTRERKNKYMESDSEKSIIETEPLKEKGKSDSGKRIETRDELGQLYFTSTSNNPAQIIKDASEHKQEEMNINPGGKEVPSRLIGKGEIKS